MVKDYNTQREPILHKEYGRNIKKLTSFIKNIEDNLALPVTLIGTGPTVNEIIDRR